MSYMKQTFVDGQVLTAEHLNALSEGIESKQDALLSGVNMKTVNGKTLLGAGNISISASNSNTSSYWAGKRAVCVGDSITAGSGTTLTYWAMLKDLMELSSMTGMGVGGSCVSATSDYGNGNSPLINRYKNIPEADLITIFMGTNDWGHETPLGTIEDTTDVSFYGALNVIIPGIMNLHPNARLVWITPMHRYGFGQSKILGKSFTYDHVPNGRNCTLEDYVNAIKKVCARYSVPVIDLYSISGLHPAIFAHKSTYMPDGLHPNKAGHEKMAYLIQKWLNLYANIEVAATSAAVENIELDKSSVPVSLGGTVTLNASLSPITATNKNISWSVPTGNAYVSIKGNGSSCVVTGIAEGNAIVMATSEDGGHTAICNIQVTNQNIPVTGISIESDQDRLTLGANTTLRAIIEPETATNQNVSWLIVSGTEYVAIEENGKNCIVTGQAEGTATISATSEDGNKTAEFDIYVTAEYVTLEFGNPFGTGSQLTDKNRVHSAEKIALTAGQKVILNDNTKYKWALRLENATSYVPESAWSSLESWTVDKSGNYTFILLKSDNANFDWSVDSNNVYDYFTIE